MSVLIIFIVFIGVNLYKNVNILTSSIKNRQEIQAKITFWQSVVQRYPEYKDAYFQAAVLEYQSGDLKQARQDNNKALLLDPNFSDALKLRDLLAK